MQFKPKGMLSLIWVLASAGVVISPLYLKWPFRTALFPLVIGSVVFVMALTETLLCFLGKEAPPENDLMVDSHLSEAADSALTGRRAFQAFAWVFAFVLLVVVVGFNLAVPLFVLLFLKLQGKEGWSLSLILTGLAWGFFFTLFIRVLHTPFPEGLLFRGLNL